MNGIVMSPSVIYGNNQLQMHEGARTLLSMNMIKYPVGNNGGFASTRCTISFVDADGIPYGGRVAGPLIAASQISGVLLVSLPVEDSDHEDTGNYADSNEDSDSGSCLTS